jgi:hypothetical protein
MKCVSTVEDKEILQEIHEGVCGNHAASRTLVGKLFRSGFCWPTALADAKHSFIGVPTANSLANSLTFRLIILSPYHLHDRLHAGAWT